jgi:hypothetical protein
MREFARSQATAHLAANLRPVVEQLDTIRRGEVDRLEEAASRLLKWGRQLPLMINVFSEACDLEQDLGISPQDALVLGSILADLRERGAGVPACFVSTNRKDYGKPAVKDLLKAFDCRYIASFRGALEFSKS